MKEDVSIKEDAKENETVKEVGGMTEAEVVTEGGVATETETATDTLPFQPEAYTFDPNRCIFCGTISDSLDAFPLPSILTPSNIAHMTQKHGFLIPDRQCLKDVEGLLDYLGQKVASPLVIECRFPWAAFASVAITASRVPMRSERTCSTRATRAWRTTPFGESRPLMRRRRTSRSSSPSTTTRRRTRRRMRSPRSAPRANWN